MRKNYEAKNATLQLQLEEAIQMLKLVAANKRTCIEVEEWLDNNFPESMEDDSLVMDLLKVSKNK